MRARLMFAFLVSAAVVSLSGAQQPKPAGPGSAAAKPLPQPTAAESATIAEVLAFEREMEAAVVRGDVKYLATILPDDFRFTHGDGWTSGGEPIRVDVSHRTVHGPLREQAQTSTSK